MPRLIALDENQVIVNLAFNVNEESSRAEIDQALIDSWTFQYDSVVLIPDINVRAELGDTWDGNEGVPPLASLKLLRIGAVNLRTEEIIRIGYEWPPGSGQIFSMSDVAQFNLEVANGARDLPQFTYPVLFSFIDDSGSYSCPDAETLHNMWLTALSLKRNALDSGRILKNLIINATTIAEINAIIDDR